MSNTVTISGKTKEIGKGTIKVKVVNLCDNKPIEKAEAQTSGRTAASDKSGLATLKELPARKHSIRVIKKYPEVDYVTFLCHYPKATLSHKAESKATIEVKLSKGETKEVEVKLKVYRLVEKVVFKRMYIHPTGNDKYGHWWVKIDENESYGWWPKYQLGRNENTKGPKPEEPPAPSEGAGGMAKVNYLFKQVYYSIASSTYAIKEHGLSQTMRGVEGELNGQTSFSGGSATRDPHHRYDGEDEFQPVVCDTRTDAKIKQSVPCNCRTDDTIKVEIRNFANSYKEKYGDRWSWRIETFGNKNCHSFQIEMMKQCKLDKFKDLLKGK